MKLMAACAALALFFTGASAFPITGNDVNCREGPGAIFESVTQYKKGTNVTVECQTEGSTVEGNNIWDKTSDGCYVADFYVKTGSEDYVVEKCKDVPKPPDNGDAGPVTDDYPYAKSCSGVDEWAYYKCQCTSFVAWRINERLGVDFHNQYKGYNWGDAKTWDDAAGSTGVPVDDEPVPGCVAQTNDGTFGHVAWVSDVGDDGSVFIEEYNHGGTEAYNTRRVSKSEFSYIHIKV